MRASPATPAGSNDVALKVAALRGDATVDGAYQAFVANRRASTSGVALDEEMTDGISFQCGYRAWARAIATMDDLLDIVINRTGRIGL